MTDNEEKEFAEMTPDEVAQQTKEQVGKGVAAVAGAVSGFTEKMEQRDVAGKTTEAIRKTGQTTREIGGTAAREATKTKEHVAKKADEGAEAGKSA